MLRAQFTDALKQALKNQEKTRLSTLRLIVAALKDKDIEARGRGITTGIEESSIVQMLQSMIKQREQSIVLYEQGGRPELVQKEQEEINIIKQFLPEMMTEEEMKKALQIGIQELGITTSKEMSRLMAFLREKYLGKMDFSKVVPLIKEILPS
jgi:uncharacterized protein YqeY